MTPAAIIQQARSDGVMLSLAPTGGLRASGHQHAVTCWLPVIRERKTELLAILKAAGEAAALARHEASDAQEREVMNWLETILEDDLLSYQEVLAKMRVKPTYRAAFLKMARGGAEGCA